MIVISWWLAGCGPPPEPAPDDDARSGELLSIADLADPARQAGTVTLSPVTVVSPLSADGVTVIAQDPGSGEGVALVRGGLLDAWPPDPGQTLTVRGYFSGRREAPQVWVTSDADLERIGDDRPVILDLSDTAPIPAAWRLVRVPAVTVTSEPDPSGKADLDLGLSLDGRFGVTLPGAGNQGTLTGVVTEAGDLAPRFEADWVGSRDPGVVVEVTVSRLLDAPPPEGTTVRLDAVQAAPWSSDRRFTVVQDDAGRGVWVDAEGWGTGRGREGQRGLWAGQLRRVGTQLVLRSWWTRELIETASRVVTVEAVHGALVERVLELDETTGSLVTDDGLIVDGRFRATDGLLPGDLVLGLVDATRAPARFSVLP